MVLAGSIKNLDAPVGDNILLETSRRLDRSMRASNIIGRLQEDMFVVVVPDMRSHEQINAVASRLISNIAVPFTIKGGPRQRLVDDECWHRDRT